MKKIFKILSIIAGSLIALSLILTLISFAIVGFKFEKLSNLKTKDFYFEESVATPVQNITIKYESSADIKLNFTDESVFSVSYQGLLTKNNRKVSTFRIDNTGNSILISENHNFARSLSIFGKTLKVNLSIPKDRSYKINIENNTGDIHVLGECNSSFLTLETDTGDIFANAQNTKITCAETLNLSTDTGDIYLNNATSKKLIASSDTGDIFLYKCEIEEETKIESDTGDVKILGEFKINKLNVEVDTGDLKTSKNGLIDALNLKIESDTGDVRIKLCGLQSDYTISATTDTGSCNLSNSFNGTKTLRIDVDTGDIYVTFSQS